MGTSGVATRARHSGHEPDHGQVAAPHSLHPLLAMQQLAGNAATAAMVQRLGESTGGPTLPFDEADLRTRCFATSVIDDLDATQLVAASALAATAVASARDEAERQTARENQMMIDVASPTRAVSTAAASGTGAERTAAIEALVDFARAHTATLPPLVERFKRQPTPSVDEKVRVLGQLAAAVGRMEFLLGSMLHQGGAWESTDNRGAMVDDYTGGEATQWCSLFTSSMWERITGDRMRAASGYKLANPSQFALDITYDTAAGGAFVGSRSTRSATARAGGNHNPWAQLRQTLDDIDGGRRTDQTKPEAVESFITTHGLRPQAGDMMIVKRGSADANSFTAGRRGPAPERRLRGAFQSHTTMVETFSGTTISTIEGNADDMVRGRTYDLTNSADVAKIIFIARPGIQPAAVAAVEAEGEAVAEEAASSGAAPADIGIAELLGPLSVLNALLVRLAATAGGVAGGSSALQTVAELSPTGDSGRAD